MLHRISMVHDSAALMCREFKTVSSPSARLVLLKYTQSFYGKNKTMLVALTPAAHQCELSTDQCSSACVDTLSETVFRLCSACFHTTHL